MIKTKTDFFTKYVVAKVKEILLVIWVEKK